MVVGQLLRRERRAWQARTKKRIAELTAAACVARPTLFLWESPRGRIDARDLRRLLEFYGCPEELIAEALRLRSLPSDPSQDSARAGAFEDAPTVTT